MSPYRFSRATLLAPIVAPSRIMQVWLQSVWMVALALSLYWYFARYRRHDPSLAILLVLPFISFPRIYDWTGGLPDFRMDLSLYIFTALTAVWYLGTYETESRVPWVFAGISAMLACLARATAPVYLLVMLGPLLAIRLATARGKRRAIMENVLWMCVPVMIAIAAFLAYNFSYLYFYYVTWSPDANRHRAVARKCDPFHHGGVARGTGAAVVRAGCGRDQLRLCERWFPRLDWRPLWLAVAPPLFLMVRGAGLNPFVSMPAIFGFFLFACVPFEGVQPVARFLWGRVAVGILIAGGAIAAAASAGQPQLYTGLSTTSMPGVRAVIDRASSDAISRGWPRVEMYAPMLGDFHSCSVSNVLTYEYGAIPRDDKAMYIPRGLIYHFPMELTFMAPEELFWKINLHGNSEQERLKDAVSIVAASPDYLLLPDEATLEWLESARSGHYINGKARELRSRLLAMGKWVRLGNPVRVGANESIEVFAPSGVY